MQHSEKQLTPAQQSLLNTCSHLEADKMYEQLSTTLSISIVNYCKEAEPGYDHPTTKTLEAWYFTLELMGCLHAIAVEKRVHPARQKK